MKERSNIKIGSDDNQHLVNESIANDMEDKSPWRRKRRGGIKTPAAVDLSFVLMLGLVLIIAIGRGC